jgi:LacI family transcriptional regulator
VTTADAPASRQAAAAPAPPKVTMRNVAERAGVSSTTASFVLTGREGVRISDRTRERVLRAAKDLGYRPNVMAQSLRTKVTRTIGLISSAVVADRYAGELIRGSLVTAIRHEHLLVVAESEGDAATETRLIEDLLSRQVDGVIYAVPSTRQVHLPQTLAGHPTVLLNCTAPVGPSTAVVPDEAEGGRAAAARLLLAGHRDGVHVVGRLPPEGFATRARLSGIESALRAAGTRLAEPVECAWWPQPAYDAVRRLLNRGVRPAALVCMNDRIALGVYQALEQAGIAVPAEVSVLSFGDSALASWLRPPVTGVAMPYFEMGRAAVEALLADPPRPAVHRVAMPLRERASVGPPRSGVQPAAR